MADLKKIIISCSFALLVACTVQKTVPLAALSAPLPANPQPPQPPLISGPEEGFSITMDAYKVGDMETTVLIGQQVLDLYPNNVWQKRTLFLMLRAAIALDNASLAEVMMHRISVEYPELADYALYYLGEYFFSKARYLGAADLYQRLIEKYPKSCWTARSAVRKAQAFREAGLHAMAAEAYQKFLRDYPHSDIGPDAGLGLGKVLTLDGNIGKAVKAYRDIMINYPGTPADQEARNALDELKLCGAEIPELNSDELYEQGKNYFKASQYQNAYDAFMRIIDMNPTYLHKADILLRSGICLVHLGKRTEAASMFEHIMKENPPEQHGAQALNWLGKLYSRLGKKDEAIGSYLKIIASYPSSEWADDALYLVGNIYRESNDVKKAVTFYDRLAREYPGSKFADSAYWWKAWAYYTSGNFKQAEQTLKELIQKYPRSSLVNQALYWQGRIAEKKPDRKRAASYYRRLLAHGPYTYYGHRAAERLSSLNLPVSVPAREESPETNGFIFPQIQINDTDTDGPPVWTEEAVKALSKEPSFKKTLELMHLGMNKEAASELWSLQDKITRKRGALLGLSKAFFELGDYYRSLILVLRNYERYLEGSYWATPDDFWLLAYPQGYWDSILSYSRKYNQDPYFIAAIIREESQFHTEALSPAGARGIMQIMPSTGEWIAQSVRIKGFDRAKLFDYDTGINLGTWFVNHLMKRFRGDARLVAAAYNAGPDAVLSWLDKNNGFDRDEFVEMIPFAETRGYVKKVMRNYAEYKRIYGRNNNKTAGIAPFFLENTFGSLLMEQSEHGGVK